RIGDLFATTVASRASLLNAKETLLHTHRPRTTTCVACLGRGAWLGTAAVARIAIFPAGNADFGIEPLSSLLQGNFQRILEISAAIDLRATAAATAAGPAEYLAKNVAKGIGETTAHACAAHARGIGVN